MQSWLFGIVILTIHLVGTLTQTTVSYTSEIPENVGDFSPTDEEKFPLVTTPVYDVTVTKSALSNDGDVTTSTGKGSSILRPPSTAFPKEARTVTIESIVIKRKKTGRNRTRTGISPKKNSTVRTNPDSSTAVLPKEDYISSTDNPKVIPTSGQLNDNPYFHGSGDLERPFAFGRGGSARDEEKGKPTTTSPDPKVEPFGQVLGVPDWKLAKEQWGIAWYIHIYSTGPLFAGLVFLGCLNLLRIKASTKLLGVGYYVTLNVLIVFLGLSRAFYLLFDGYNSGGSFPSPIPCCLYDLAHPCLSTALAVLFLALIKETKLDFFPRCARRPGILAAYCILHFALTLTLDVVSGLILEEKSSLLTGILLLVSRLVFVVWTTILVVSYFAAFKRLRKAALRKQGEMIRVTFTKLHIDGAQLPKKLPKPTLALSVNVALLAAVFGAGLVLTRVYGIVFVDGPIAVGDKLPDPWPWWIYHLVSRLFEILSCAGIIFVASQPLRNFETPRVSDRDSDSFVPRRLPRPFSFRCCRKEVDVDLDDSYDAYFSNHLVHYNNRGFRNSGFSHSLEGHHRRWDSHRTNSLPPFDQTRPNGHHQGASMDKPNNPRGTSGCHIRDHSTMPVQRLSSVVATDKVVPVKPVLGCQIITGTSRSNRSVIENMTACGTHGSAKIPPLVPPHATIDSNRTTSSSGRPTSMLFKDNGFIRFRREDDPEQPMELSDETTEEDGSSVKDGDSVLAQAGSGTHSLCESDFVQSTLSPFFQHFGHHQHHHQPHHCGGPPRVKIFSRCSLDTLDNSCGDASSEQLSNVTSKNGHSNGALDCHSKRQGGSTCSSESAANSFDVTFYLQGLSRQSTPAIRSVSPLASCRRYHGVPTNLDLSKDPLPRGCSDGGVVNVACGTEDVTPDSAVFMDLHLSDDTDPESVGVGKHALQRDQKPTYHRDNSAFDRSRSEEPPGSPVTVPWSHSLNDLSAFEVIRGWKTSKTWLNRLKGSSFSLNGYELLPPVDRQDVSGKPAWVRRVNSDRRKRTVEGTNHPLFSSMSDVVGQVKDGGRFLERGMIQGDSGLLGDCQELQVDMGVQTDDNYPINSLFTRLRGEEKITAFNLIEERD